MLLEFKSFATTCHSQCERCFWVGKVLLLAREGRKFGKQLLACFGQCGRLEIELFLKMMFVHTESKIFVSFFCFGWRLSCL